MVRLCGRSALLAAVLAGCFVDGPGGDGTKTGSATESGSSTADGETDTQSSGSTTTTSASSTTTTSASSTATTAETTSANTTTEVTTTGTDTTTGGFDQPPDPPECNALYFTDFSTDPKNDFILVGTWMWVQTDQLVRVHGQGSNTIARLLDFNGGNDYVVHAAVRIDGGDPRASVRARFAGSEQPGSWEYYFSLISATNGGEFLFGTYIGGQINALKTAQTAIEPGEWHVLSLRVSGTSLMGALDFDLTAMGSDMSLLQGGPSFGVSGNGDASFKWFQVCEP